MPPPQQQGAGTVFPPGAIPTPDFSRQMVPATQPGREMPQPPAEILGAPTYEEPEPMGWKKALLGVGLSAGAQLVGQGAQTADQYFYGPERRAEADYARELGEYTQNQDSWDKYYGRLMQSQNIGVQNRQVDATEDRNRTLGEYYRGQTNRGIVVNKELRDPVTGELRGPAAEKFQGGTANEIELQTYSQYMYGMNFGDLDRFQRMDVTNRITNDTGGLYQSFGEEGATWRPKLDASGTGAPVTTFDRPGARTGGVDDLSRTQAPREEMQGFTASQRANVRTKYDERILDAQYEPEVLADLIKQREIELVRGLRHRRGERISNDRIQAYVAAADGDADLALQWAKEDGYTF